jgi:adenosylhomocysteine nucleosidase
MSEAKTEPGPILVVAALERELAPLARRRRPAIQLLVTGEGRVNAKRALEPAIEAMNPRAVVGIGFAGGLSPSLGVADLVIAQRVIGESGTIDATPGLVAAAAEIGLDRVLTGVAITVDEVICEAEAKARLSETIAGEPIAVVDMESIVLAEVCGHRGLPFIVVRAVTDLLEEDLPVNFNRCRDADGRVSEMRVLKEAMRRPGSLAGLRELNRRAGVCAGRLADFAGCLARLIDEKRIMGLRP